MIPPFPFHILTVLSLKVLFQQSDKAIKMDYSWWVKGFLLALLLWHQYLFKWKLLYCYNFFHSGGTWIGRKTIKSTFGSRNRNNCCSSFMSPCCSDHRLCNFVDVFFGTCSFALKFLFASFLKKNMWMCGISGSQEIKLVLDRLTINHPWLIDDPQYGQPHAKRSRYYYSPVLGGLPH